MPKASDVKKNKNLTDNRIFEFEIVDKAKAAKNGSVLATLQGYATLSDDKTNRNKHFYPKGFWDKVLKDNASIQERLDTKTFFGSSRHPGKGQNPVPEFGDQDVPISHAIREFKVDDKGVYVKLDVLDTPAGREVKTFIDYGSKLGISTRAYGEVDEDSKTGFRTPKLDSYHFITWDLVSFPAFSETRMSAIADSWNVEVGDISADMSKEAFQDGLKKLPRHEAKAICDYSGLAFDEIYPEEASSETERALEQAMDKIIDLEKKLESASDGAAVKAVKKEASTKIRKMKSEFDTERKQWKQEKSELETKFPGYDQMVTKLKRSIKFLKDKIFTLKSEKIALLDKVTDLKNMLADNRTKVSDLRTENEELQTDFDNLNEEYTKLQNLNNHLESKLVKSTEKEIQDSASIKKKTSTVRKVKKAEPRFQAFDSSKTVSPEMEGLKETLNKVNN